MRNIIKFAFLIVLAFVLTACGTSSDNDTTSGSEGDKQAGENNTSEEQSVEREELELTFEVADYDEENNALNITFDTNLPDETAIYRAVLRDDEGKNRLIEYEITIDEARQIAFGMEGIDPETITNKEYQLVLEFNVTERTNSNLFSDKHIGGSFAEMDEMYKDSEQVQLTDLGEAYTVTLDSSNSNAISEDKFNKEAAAE
ncbi:LptM family lipoprotein [Ornithinibacillus halotolerans]|uniref:Lipoprotein n=1 Tax=Ornithinibacillus halotolerans TaxID=1274357 RepID=A0A916RU58_9BACI|nr:hypothetical protein [Ornithinibacillus halotolerans]GGA71252.1 hypothetical protein GCM10008025_13910 [Ornithinibacillus halotolerans]